MNSAELSAVVKAGTAVQDRHSEAGIAASLVSDWQTAHSEMDRAIGAAEATNAIIAALTAAIKEAGRE